MSDVAPSRVAVVTGGASGIGRAIAAAFVERGDTVVLGDRNPETLREAVDELGDAHASRDVASGVEVDVTDEAAVEALMSAAVERHGRLDVLVNSAGLGWMTPIVNHGLEEWNTVVDVCLTGTFLATKHAARRILEHDDGGVIVNLASINARQAAEGMSAYCAAKAGVEMFTKVAAMELASANVRVVGIAPGLIDTPLTTLLSDTEHIREAYLHDTPISRVGTTEDIAQAALYLTSPGASWVTGETLVVDGGATTREYPRLLELLGMSGVEPT